MSSRPGLSCHGKFSHHPFPHAGLCPFVGSIATIMLFDFRAVNRRMYGLLALYQRWNSIISTLAKPLILQDTGVRCRLEAMIGFLNGVGLNLAGLINDANPGCCWRRCAPFQFRWLFRSLSRLMFIWVCWYGILRPRLKLSVRCLRMRFAREGYCNGKVRDTRQEGDDTR